MFSKLVFYLNKSEDEVYHSEQIKAKKASENKSDGNNRMMFLMCKSADEVPHGAIVVTHEVVSWNLFRMFRTQITFFRYQTRQI